MLALKLNSRFAQGVALGNSAYGFGTNKAFMQHRKEGVVACLTMVLAGIFMVLLGPVIIRFIMTYL